MLFIVLAVVWFPSCTRDVFDLGEKDWKIVVLSYLHTSLGVLEPASTKFQLGTTKAI